MAFRGFQRSVGTQFGAAFPVAGDHILLPRGLPYIPHGRRAAHQHHHYVYQQRALGTHPPPPQWGGGGSGFPVAGEYIRTTAAQQLLPPQNYYSYYVHQDFSINPPPPPQQQFDSVREDETLILNGTTVHPRQQRQQHAVRNNNNNGGGGGGGGFGLSESQIEKCVKIIKITNSCPNYYVDNRGGATATAGEEGSEVCAICLDDLYCPDQTTNNHNTVGVLDCRHVYHSDCIRPWLRVKNFCPMCKSVAHS